MDQDALKSAVGKAAAERVSDGMVLGLGTGSTAEAFLRALGERIARGLTVRGVPTSERTAQLCRDLSIPLTDLDADPRLDLAIDGADEIDPELSLIKGGGGALLREKIVAAAADDMLVIADGSKLVPTLGAFPLPVEVVPFGVGATLAAIRRVCAAHAVGSDVALRRKSATSAAEGAADNGPGGARPWFVTDGGHWIADCSVQTIHDPAALDTALRAIPGVVETGLFIGMAGLALVALDGEVVERRPAKPLRQV